MRGRSDNKQETGEGFMRRFVRFTLIVGFGLGLGVLTACSAEEGPSPATSSGGDSNPAAASARLLSIFEDHNERNLALDPLSAISRGDLRYADRFGDYTSVQYFGALAESARDSLAELAAIDRSELSGAEQIAYDAFRAENEQVSQAWESGVTAILRRLPLDQLFGQHVTFPDMSNGESLAPFETLDDYENGLLRLSGFASYLDRVQEPMREGITTGHVQPTFVTQQLMTQIDAALVAGVDGSPLIMPTRSFPDEIAEADRRRLEAGYREAVAKAVLPAYSRLRDFLSQEYLSASRTEAPGLCTMPDGERLYEHSIALHTSSELSAEQIHQLGLEEVARIRSEMMTVLQRVGFEGSLRDFFEHLRADPRFQFASKQEMLDAYEEVKEEVEPRLAALFPTLPSAALEIRPVPPAREQSAGGAYYFPGTPDGSRPGVFYVNTFDLPSRTNTTVETLFLHEGVPGHHLQGSLAQEDEALPSFLRFGWNTAYGEGWGLYAESLGPELGLFEDPYQLFGHLDLEMFRALRLVVDTGLHDKCWSREEAVEYMLDNSSLGRTTLVQDVDRYVVWPGQALAYKLGQLKIRELRTRAEEKLGDSFELPSFHQQILGTGSVPLTVLEAKVDNWIENSL